MLAHLLDGIARALFSTTTTTTRGRAHVARALCQAAVMACVALLSAPALAVTPAPWAEGGRSRPQDLRIELMTFGPGSDVPSWFGHTAVAVEDRRLNQRRVYNYGMFSNDPAMVLKYVMGRLEFWVAPTSYDHTLRSYAEQDRDVRLLTLNLSPQRRAQVAQFLEKNIEEAHRFYLYHHYYDNCATRVRDVFDLAVDGQFGAFATQTEARMSLRDHTRRHAHIGLLDFGMMYAMTAVIDEPITAWDEMFLPVELERHVKAFSYLDDDGELVPLAGEEQIYHAAKARQPTPEAPSTLWPWMAFWGALLVLLAALLGWLHATKPHRLWRVLYGLYQASVGLAFGGAGMLLLFMWFATDHTVTYRNENLFWTNPLTFLVCFVGLGVAFGRSEASERLPKLWAACAAVALLGQALKILPWFEQDTSLTAALCAPLVFGMAAVTYWVEKKKRRSASET